MSKRERAKVKNATGCKQCWSSDANWVWEARSRLQKRLDLVDSAHLGVSLVACTQCEQSYLSVFTETINWRGGNDPVHWTLIPIMSVHAIEMAKRVKPVSESLLSDICGKASSAQRYSSSSGESRSYWGVGLQIGMHD